MAVSAGNGVIADRLQCFDCGVFGLLTAHLKVSDLAVFPYNQGVAEDGRVAQLFHKRTCKLGEGIAEDDNLGLRTQLIQKFLCTRNRINFGNGFLDLLQSKSVFLQDIQTIFH